MSPPFQNGVPSVGEPQRLTPQGINDEDRFTLEIPIPHRPQAIIRLEGLKCRSCGKPPAVRECESCGADWPECLTCTPGGSHLCFSCIEDP